jgi:hypothetical protein
MFRQLTRRWRRRAGLWVALAYLVCMIAPPVALAFTDGKAAAHCLTEDHHVAASVHVHPDGTKHVHANLHDGAGHQAGATHEHATHDHGTHEHAAHGSAMHGHAMDAVADQAQAEPQADTRDSGKSSGGTCCGLFCLNAAAFEMTPSIGVVPRRSLLQPALEAHVIGHEPARIDRPPILLLSL